MQNKSKGSLEEAVQSYAHWWREAGFHTATDPVAHGWRQQPSAPFWQRDPAPAAEVAAPRVAEVAAPPAPRTSTDMPDSLPAFLEGLAQASDQPEAGWDGALILPPALEQAPLLVIVEMPAMAAVDAETLVEPAQRRFLQAMLASIGMGSLDIPIATLAARRPPGGLLDEATHKRLAARMTHYLALARPQAAMLLGDRTSRALIGPQWAPGDDGLRKINLAGGTMDAVSLPGLDLLMSRPAAKAKSWQALRLLQGRWTG